VTCSSCDLRHLPVCAGELDPSACSGSPERRAQRSLFASTLAGWPAITRDEASPHAAAIDATALASPRRPPLDVAGRIDRAKPRIALGVAQRPPPGCIPCAAKT
jgi:hypothetical protein